MKGVRQQRLFEQGSSLVVRHVKSARIGRSVRRAPRRLRASRRGDAAFGNPAAAELDLVEPTLGRVAAGIVLAAVEREDIVARRTVRRVLATSLTATLDDACSYEDPAEMSALESISRLEKVGDSPAIKGASLPAAGLRGARMTLVFMWMSCRRVGEPSQRRVSTLKMCGRRSPRRDQSRRQSGTRVSSSVSVTVAECDGRASSPLLRSSLQSRPRERRLQLLLQRPQGSGTASSKVISCLHSDASRRKALCAPWRREGYGCDRFGRN